MSTRTGRATKARERIVLETATDEQLLNTRFSDLPLMLNSTLMALRVGRLMRELSVRGIALMPHTWLSEEFFTPDGVAGFAVPFYLAHPRLMRLERTQMLECEGASEAECRRILRHEAGHVLDGAYAFYKRARYRQLFGNPSRPYPTSYKPRVDSRAHVVNLSGWYAQAHPVEDFAETFAVWLNPYHSWRENYKGWPALEKLEYVDALMREIKGHPLPRVDRTEIEPLRALRKTLREHYTSKRAHFAWVWPANYDHELRRIFSDDARHSSAPLATHYLRQMRATLRTRIAEGTGIHAYVIDQLLRQMIARSQGLGLRVIDTSEVAMQKLIVLLTMQSAAVLNEGVPRVSL